MVCDLHDLIKKGGYNTEEQKNDPHGSSFISFMVEHFPISLNYRTLKKENFNVTKNKVAVLWFF